MASGIDEILEKTLDVNNSMIEILDDYSAFYKIYKRHYYCEVTLFLIAVMERIDKGELPGETVEVLVERITYLIELAGKMCDGTDIHSECKESSMHDKRKCKAAKGKCRDYKYVSFALNKLFDHIQLEYIRLQQISKQERNIGTVGKVVVSQVEEFSKMEQSMKENLAQLEQNIENEKSKLDDLLKATQKQSAQLEERSQQMMLATVDFKMMSKDVEDKTAKLDGDVRSIYTQLVSVLGIFTAIAFSMFGGVTMVSDIVDVLTGANITILQAITLCVVIALGMFNILYMMLYAIGKMIGKPIAFTIDVEENSSMLKRVRLRHPMFFYVNTMLIVILVTAGLLYYRTQITQGVVDITTILFSD